MSEPDLDKYGKMAENAVENIQKKVIVLAQEEEEGFFKVCIVMIFIEITVSNASKIPKFLLMNSSITYKNKTKF